MASPGRHGDDVAELYRRHAPALQRRCASIVKSPEEARDLVQETFARYIAARGSFTDKASAFTVLYRIATNASIDRIRRRKTKSEDELDAEVHAGDLGNEPRRVGDLHDLAMLTRGLSEEELTVAVLHHLDGYTQDAIAASLDISRKTVGKILGKFEEHVKKRAARLGYDGDGKRSANG
jgi:RNA polymerase sigma-70 factor, ECF subfamily